MMDQKPNLDLVILAVQALYNNPDKTEKEKASQWLLDLQKSVHVWSIADELLHQKRDLESCYFAAQTMRTKIQHSFHELPIDVHDSLKESLLEHVSQISESTNTIIVTQLCVALADLILQMPSWKRASIDLIHRFSQTNTWPLLETLAVLPEELESRSVRLGENRRLEMLEDLKSCFPMVMEFLKYCCNTYGNNLDDNITINVKIIRCLTSWISVGAVNLHELAENIVINFAFQILNFKPENGKSIAGALHDAATDCICTLLQSLEDNNNQQVLESYLFNNIVNLEDPYHMSSAHEDEAKCMDYCRLFTELAESFLDKILSNSSPGQLHYSVKILDLVLMCVGHHDYEVAEITFNLWCFLSEELYQKNNKELTEMFRPYVARLIAGLYRHCQMEPDFEGLLEDGNEFKDFRLKVSDLIKDVVFIVGSSSCFREMFMYIQEPTVTWEQIEAALFVMQSIAKNVLPTENEIVPKVVEAILNVSENTHIAVRYTSVLLLGELCEWIEKHSSMLDPILNFLVCCLPKQGVGAAAAVALQNICATCSDHMPRHLPILIQLLHQVDTFAITNNAVIGLVKGLATIASCLPHTEMTNAVRELCRMQLNSLVQLIEQDVVPVRGTKSDPVLWLDRLSAVFRHIDVRLQEGEIHPCKPVVLETWPVLSRTLTKYQMDSRIMERCCRSIRYMLRCVSQQVQELLESLVGLMLQIYAEHKHPCFLYLGSILVDEYATDPRCVAGLLDMLQAFLEPTFQLLQEENGLKNHPDTVDDFFRLCARFMQRAPTDFLQCTALLHILQCALLASSLDHKEANMSVMKFFYDLINQGMINNSQPDYSKRKQRVTSILEDFGQQLVTTLIQSSVFQLHTYMLSEVADVIVQLLYFNRETAGKWIANSLNTLPKHSNGGIMAATPEQLNEIHQKISGAGSSKSVTHSLKDLVILYR